MPLCLLHSLNSLPVFWPCLSASHILTLQAFRLSDFSIQQLVFTVLGYGRAAGYLATLLHEYKYCAKLPPPETAAHCDEAKEVQGRYKIMQSEMS